MSKIFSKIQEELNDFNNNPVIITDAKFSFSQKDVVENNLRLYNSKFKAGTVDKEGFRMYFKNIVKNPCQAAMKAIKFNPSDIMLSPAPGHSSYKSWIMDRDFKYWMKKNRFNKVLNRLFSELPIQGTVVLKLINNVPHFVDLRNLVNEQSAKSLKKASYVIEEHYMTPEELREKEGVWENIGEVIEIWRNSKAPYIRIVERYGEIENDEFGGDPNEHTYSRFIVYIPESEHARGRLQLNKAGVVVHKQKMKREDNPYREFHWERIPGRWLGVGRVEILSDPQVRTNEITNLRVKSSYIAALNVWQTRDDNIKKNLVHDIATGQIITAQDRIERIPTEDRNLSSFVEEERGWLANRDENTFNHDVIRGERPPAGTPLGSAQMAAQMIASYFEHIREDVASDIKEMIYEDIIPSFKKSFADKEHYLRLVGEDLEKWQNMKVNDKAFHELFRQMNRTKKIPTKSQFEAIKAGIKQKIKDHKSDVFIPSQFYDNVKYEIDIMITGQDRDMRVQSSNMAMILQTMIADPTVLIDPAKRKVFGKQLEAVGLDINDIQPITEGQGIEADVQEQQGGGISSPNMPQSIVPTMGGEAIV